MTLFAGYFPTKILIYVLDNFFKEGWSAIYRVSIALLKLWEEEFLTLNDIAYVARKVHELREDFTIEKETLFKVAYSPAINKLFGENNSKLVSLEQEYFKQQIVEKMTQPAGTWTAA